jgi:hypothetical protein
MVLLTRSTGLYESPSSSDILFKLYNRIKCQAVPDCWLIVWLLMELEVITEPTSTIINKFTIN